MNSLTDFETELREIELKIEEIYNGVRPYSEMAGLEHMTKCLESDIRAIQFSYIEPSCHSMSI